MRGKACQVDDYTPTMSKRLRQAKSKGLKFFGKTILKTLHP